MHGSSKASFPEILPRCVIPWENWSDNLRSVLPSKVPRRLFICKMGRFRSTNEGTGTTSASLAPHTVDYLFLWGIDAIICSPLMTCSCTRHSLDWAAVSPTVFWPFRARWDRKQRGRPLGITVPVVTPLDHYLFGANENVLPSNEDNEPILISWINRPT